jgi:DNA repair protein RadC
MLSGMHRVLGQNLHEASDSELISYLVTGLRPAAAARTLMVLRTLAERWAPEQRPSITSPRDALLLFEDTRLARRETVAVLLLDARHRLIRRETVAVGTLNSSRLHARDVFAPALRCDAVAVIVGHNHPSGDPTPSCADRTVTCALRTAGELLGVPLLDHVIVAREGHYSFRDADGWDRAEGER